MPTDQAFIHDTAGDVKSVSDDPTEVVMMMILTSLVMSQGLTNQPEMMITLF